MDEASPDTTNSPARHQLCTQRNPAIGHWLSFWKPNLRPTLLQSLAPGALTSAPKVVYFVNLRVTWGPRVGLVHRRSVAPSALPGTRGKPWKRLTEGPVADY